MMNILRAPLQRFYKDETYASPPAGQFTSCKLLSFIATIIIVIIIIVPSSPTQTLVSGSFPRMRSVAWILLGSSVGVVARPAPEARGEGLFIIDPTGWSLPTRYFFEAVGRKVAKVRDLPTFPNAPVFALDTAAIPLGMFLGGFHAG